MDPQVSTSFIPKKALTEQKVRAGGMGLFTLIAILVLLVSLIAAAAAFGYGQLVQKQLADKKAQLDINEGAFDPATIQVLVRLNSRLDQAKLLLAKHVAPSGIFDFLADNTLVNVQFTSMQYALNPDGTATVELDGEADSFSTVALQSDALGASQSLKDVVFSNITVEPSGRVSFVVQATVDPSLISYSKELAQTPAPVQTTATDTEPTTTAQ